jgi:hypothetical protein
MLSAAGAERPRCGTSLMLILTTGALSMAMRRESLAEEGELVSQKGCTQPARNTVTLPPWCTVLPLASRWTATEGGPTPPPAGSHYT